MAQTTNMVWELPQIAQPLLQVGILGVVIVTAQRVPEMRMLTPNTPNRVLQAWPVYSRPQG